MGQVRDLIGAQGTAAAGMHGPAEHPRLEEGAIDDQLTAALEQVEQGNLALGSVELVLLVHSQPRHPPAFGAKRVTGAGQSLLLHEELLARSLPLLVRHDWVCVHRGIRVFNRSSRHFDFSFHLSSAGLLLSGSCEILSLPAPPARQWMPRQQRSVPWLPNRMDTSFTSSETKLDCQAASIGVTGEASRFRQSKLEIFIAIFGARTVSRQGPRRGVHPHGSRVHGVSP